jgi:hypothetical protein
VLGLVRKVDEVQVFDEQLQGLDGGGLGVGVPCADGAKQPKGRSPGIDGGVKVNAGHFRRPGSCASRRSCLRLARRTHDHAH